MLYLVEVSEMFLINACHKGKQRIVSFKDFQAPLSKQWNR